MANTNRPYEDDKIVERAAAVPDDRLLDGPHVSNVIVAYAERDKVNGWIEHAEISWTTTVRVLPDTASEILDEAARSR